MPTLIREFRYNLKRFAPMVLMVLFLVYIYYHTISGERGFATWYALRQQVAALSTENAMLQQKVTQLQIRVARLSTKTPDRDYLDEQARHMLPVLKPTEQVIFLNQKP